MREIEQHQLFWKIEGSKFRFRLKGVAQWSEWIEVSPSDLAAIAAVLNEKPVYYDRDTHALFTGAETIGN